MIGDSGTLLALEETTPGMFELSQMTVAGGNPIGEYLLAFGEDEAGELYVMTKKGFDPAPVQPDASLFRIEQVLAPPPPAIALDPVAIDQVNSPVALTHAGDGSGRLFVVEQRGQIRIMENGGFLPAPQQVL